MSADALQANWKSYEQFAAGIDGNRLPPSDALAGRSLVLPVEDESLALTLDAPPALRWRSGAGPEAGGRYEAIHLGDETYYLDLALEGRATESITALVSLASGRTLAVRSTIAPEPVPDAPRIRQSYTSAALDPDAVDPASFEPAPSRDLIGRRILYRYSPNHLYEHTYLNSERYAWQCLEGVERGLADCDMATVYRFDEHRYLLTFREFRLEVASILVLDMDSMRSTGKFFGLTDEGDVLNEPAGAHIMPLSESRYPDGVAPI